MARRARGLIALLLAVSVQAQIVRVNTASNGILRVPLEDYLEWVLAGEAGGITEDPALEAIAIAARSYARANLGRHQAEGFDFCETTHCQDARPGVSTPKLRAAVDRTANEVLWRDGRILPGFHHRHCGGRTATPREVWQGQRDEGLVSIADPYCVSSPGAQWRAVLDLPGHSLEIARRTASGRVASLRDNGRLIDAEAFHLQVGRTLGWNLLRSRLYDLRPDGPRFLVTGRGQGHGVGLCQSGAASRARAGHAVETILKAYFGDAAVGLTPSHRRWLTTTTSRLDIRYSSDSPAAQAETALSAAEKLCGLRASRRFTVTAYPTLDLYRDLTGMPGFVAASTRGGRIRLQPLSRFPNLQHTLRHEFLHALIGAHTLKPLPEWFSEGLVLWLESPGSPPAALSKNTEAFLLAPPSERALRAAYENARGAVAALVYRHGRQRVMDSLRLGLP